MSIWKRDLGHYWAGFCASEHRGIAPYGFPEKLSNPRLRPPYMHALRAMAVVRRTNQKSTFCRVLLAPQENY